MRYKFQIVIPLPFSTSNLFVGNKLLQAEAFHETVLKTEGEHVSAPEVKFWVNSLTQTMELRRTEKFLPASNRVALRLLKADGLINDEKERALMIDINSFYGKTFSI